MTELQIRKAVALRRVGITLAAIGRVLGSDWKAIDMALTSDEAADFMDDNDWHLTPYRHRVVPTHVPQWKDKHAFLTWVIMERLAGAKLEAIAIDAGYAHHSSILKALRSPMASAILRKRGLRLTDGSEVVDAEEVLV